MACAADANKWPFLDTETTGLAGGGGTFAFLVGLAWWDAGGLQAEQLFMRDADEEFSVLSELSRRMRERPVLVTFNGKSFDWPLLEGRFRMTRAIEAPSFELHLDLLHPARRIWKPLIGSVRLSDLEREVLQAESLGWSRMADIDCSQIAEMYFEYVRGGRAEPVAGVLRHNRMDLRGLAALSGKLFQTLAQPGAADIDQQNALEMYGLSRLLECNGDYARARACYERAIETGLPPKVDRTARHALARLAKRERDFVRAAELWHELAYDLGPNAEACEQLAMEYERRGDLPEALRMAQEAVAEVQREHQMQLSQYRHDRLLGRLSSRLARLDRKIARAELRRARRGSTCAPLKPEVSSSLRKQPRTRYSRTLQHG